MFVFDQDPGWNSTVPYLNSYLSDAASQLASKGMAVQLNCDSVYVTNSADVLGYTSWGSNDHYANNFTQYAKPHNTWAPGAIAETYVSTSARSFANPPVYGQSLIADLVSEGVSGAKGYVYEPFSSAMAISSILFSTYTGGYNLAESYFQSSAYLSWMDVIVGDPKTSIDGTSPAALPVQLSSLSASFDFAKVCVAIQWTTQSEIQDYGFYVQRRPGSGDTFADIDGSFIPGALNSLVVHTYSYADHPPAAGLYQYRLRQVDLDGAFHYSEAVEVSATVATGIRDDAMEATDFRLEQNYPNPFNPTTTIQCVVGGVVAPSGAFRSGAEGPTTVVSGQGTGNSWVRIVVYDMLGREVAVLANGHYPAGRHSFTFDGRALASGEYVCRLEAEGHVISKKMALVR